MNAHRAWPGKRIRQFEPLESRLLFDAWDDVWTAWNDIPDMSSGVDTSSTTQDSAYTDNSDNSGSQDTTDSYDDSTEYPSFPDVPTRYPPSAPALLTAQTPSSSSVYLSWTNTTLDQDTVKVLRFGTDGKWHTIARLHGDATHYTDSGLLPGSQYSYVVQAENDAGSSDYSNIATAVLQEPDDPTLIGRFGHLAGGNALVPFTFFDADGTQVTMTMSGPGTGLIHQTPDGYDLELTGTTLKTSVTISARGGDGRVAMHDLTAGDPANPADHTALGTLNARVADFSGMLTITGPASSLSLGNVTGETISIGAPATAPKSPSAVSLRLATVADTTIDSAIGIKSLTAVAWTDSDPGVNPDSIAAPSLGTLDITGQKKTRSAPAIAGDFAAALDLAGAANGKTLGSAAIAGSVTGAWQIAGAAGSISIKSAANWTLALSDLPAAAGTLAAVSFTDKSATSAHVQITAASLGTLAAQGNLDNLQLALRQPPDKKRPALGRLTIAGNLAHSAIRAAGNIGAVRIGVLDHSLLFAGVVGAVSTLPAAPADFAPPAASQSARIAVVTLTGVRGEAAAFINAVIAAPAIGQATLPRRATAVADPDQSAPFGFASLLPLPKYAGPLSAAFYVSGADSIVA